MPILQVSAAMLGSLIEGATGEASPQSPDSPGKKGNSDNFSSLLDMVGSVSYVGGVRQDVRAKTTAVDDSKGGSSVSDARDSSSANVNKGGQDSSDNNRRARDDKRAFDQSGRDVGSDKLVAPRRNPQAKNNDDKVERSAETGNSRPVTENANAADNSSAGQVSAGAESDSSFDSSAEKAGEHVDNLQSLLDMLAQFLAGGGAVAAPLVPVSEQSQFMEGGCVGAASDIDSGQGGDTLAVFADLQDVLTNLKQFLQGVSGQDAPLSSEQLQNLADINKALQSDLDALKNLLPQSEVGVAEDKRGLFPVLSQLQGVLGAEKNEEIKRQIVDVKSLLKDDVELIRDALRKFGNDLQAAQNNKQSDASGQSLSAGASDNVGIVAPVKNDAEKNDRAIIASRFGEAVSDNAPAVQTTVQNSNNIVGGAVASQASVREVSGSGDFSGGAQQQGGNSGNSSAQLSSLGGAQQAKAAGAAAASQFSGMLNRAQNVPVTEQVVFHIKSMSVSHSSKITIQLNPEELGKVEISINVDVKKKAVVIVTADNRQTLDLLQRDSSGLQRALADAGLKADENTLTFNLRGGEKEGHGQGEYQAASQYKKSQPDEPTPEELSAMAMAGVTRSYVVNISDSLNIKV